MKNIFILQLNDNLKMLLIYLINERRKDIIMYFKIEKSHLMSMKVKINIYSNLKIILKIVISM
jgi:hypothetical protein